jgi:hypothetical protein
MNIMVAVMWGLANRGQFQIEGGKVPCDTLAGVQFRSWLVSLFACKSECH